jgi:hypothetical protein|tara:strand:- start:701 stop:820 length:120 start_codon:yes stop_codon:yes gene_type:complete
MESFQELMTAPAKVIALRRGRKLRQAAVSVACPEWHGGV